MQGIFISYRREDSAGYAGRLYDRLAGHFGSENVFMDVEGIEPGVDFVHAIEKAVTTCRVLIVLIGDRWLSLADGSGRRRLDDPNDFIRIETSTALRRNIRVVPVLLEGTSMPRIDELPDDLEGLSRRQAITVSHKQWEVTTGELIVALDRIFAQSSAARGGAQKPANVSGENGQSAALQGAGRWRSGLWVGGTLVIGVLAAAGGLWSPWRDAQAPVETANPHLEGSSHTEIGMPEAPDPTSRGQLQRAPSPSREKPLDPLREPADSGSGDMAETVPLQVPKSQQQGSVPETTDSRGSEQSGDALRGPKELSGSVKVSVSPPVAASDQATPATQKPRVSSPVVTTRSLPEASKSAALSTGLGANRAAVPERPLTAVNKSPTELSPVANLPQENSKSEAQVARPPSASRLPVPGDRWSYRVRGIWSNTPEWTMEISVHSVEADRVNESISRSSAGSAKGSKRRRIVGGAVQLVDGSYAGREFSPYLGAFEALQVGEEWEKITMATAAGDWSGWYSQGEVGDWEQVSVPAGSFRALRVQVQCARSASGSSSERDREPVRIYFEVWFAPEIKRYLKMTRKVLAASGQTLDRDTFELTSFQQD
ncbi:MAG: TIR domain-containing protein [Gammaproteobacteria bacterium]|nr:TIR domain-containing protein [Gammaproteobacteria bacterium]